MKTISTYRDKRGSLLRLALAVVIALPLAGCGDILKVVDPDIVTPESLESEIGLQTLRNGALGEFNASYSGRTDGVITMGGLMSDEWMHSGTFTDRFAVEVRNMQLDNGSLGGVFRRMHQARTSLETTAAKLEEEATGPDERIGEMYFFAGMLYTAFAETYCSGVPFSTEEEFGAPETTIQMLDRAVARFNSALSAPGVAADLADAARVGLGRALLNLGDMTGAASAVGSVADDFVFWTYHSSNSASQRNPIWDVNRIQGRWSIGDMEGVNGLDFRTAGDPRITHALCPACAFDKSEQVPGTPNLTDNWVLSNYSSHDDPIRLATGIEARLIEAEAQLGTPATWLATLNGLRAQWATLAPILNGDEAGVLAPLVDPGTAAGREDLHFRERAFWLYSTGHRLGDLRRLVRQYGRGTETVYPTGVYWKPGANYGVAVNIPIPDNEDNNPLFAGCLDLNA